MGAGVVVLVLHELVEGVPRRDREEVSQSGWSRHRPSLPLLVPDLLELHVEAIELIILVDEIRAAAALAPAVGRYVAGLAAFVTGTLVQGDSRLRAALLGVSAAAVGAFRRPFARCARGPRRSLLARARTWRESIRTASRGP